MENNENRGHDNVSREQNQSGKKPYHKHNRRRGHGPRPQQAQNGAEVKSGESITSNAPRFDVPPAPGNETQVTVNQVKSERPQNNNRSRFQKHRHGGKKQPRGENKPRNDMFAAALESVLSDKPESTVPEADYSEYVTTAGSLDAEVVDEINSISSVEAERLEEASAEEAAEPVAELATYSVIGVRFKTGGKVYYFDPRELKFSRGEAVIVETSRGLEFGICELSNRTVTERDVVLPLRTVVRRAGGEDIARHEECVKYEKEAFTICAEKILDHKLGMKLIDVEYAFDGSKLLFYFTADGRVDFRELVKDLAAVFRTRIELRQIGIRDETKLLGGIGICGRPFCCKTFLSDFVQVSIKMAKEQNLSLNSAKISGACGRLMCCLRYEYDTYQEEIKKTPKVDQIVSTPDGDGTVIEVQPLAGLVRVRFGTKAEMLTPKVYHRDEVTVIGGKGVKPKDEGSEA